MAAADESDEEEWEESLVLVELSGVVDQNWTEYFQRGDCKILGVETEKPILQVERYIFTGEYKQTVGTSVLLEVDEQPYEEVVEDYDSEKPVPKLKYKYCTHKKLVMNRCFLTEKEQAMDTGDHQVPSTSADTKTSYKAPLQETPTKNVSERNKSGIADPSTPKNLPSCTVTLERLPIEVSPEMLSRVHQSDSEQNADLNVSQSSEAQSGQISSDQDNSIGSLKNSDSNVRDESGDCRKGKEKLKAGSSSDSSVIGDTPRRKVRKCKLFDDSMDADDS